MSWTFSRDDVRQAGLLAGPMLALAVYLLLPDRYLGVTGESMVLPAAGRATLALMAWMAVWWLTEAIDIASTALLPVATFPMFGILPIERAASPYASDLVFLFMGGFILALGMQRWGLDRRIALSTLRVAGTRPMHIVAAFMLVTAVLSMWVSNTATVAMMLPIATSVIDRMHTRHFAVSLLLGIAYAASIGGLATIIGSPPNGILVQFAAQQYGQEITFARWMLIGGPTAVVLLPAAWLLVTRRIRSVPHGDVAHALFDTELRSLGTVRRAEWLTMVVFACTASLWMLRPLLTTWPALAGISDAGIAMAGAMALFVLPSGDADRHRVMDWQTATRLPWSVLILFGGGLSLAQAVQANDVAPFLAAQVMTLRDLPTLLLVGGVVTGMMFLTEFTSNTATTATLVPVLAGMAGGLAVDPWLLMLPATLAASCAFMMPVATPPNAIVFASGHVTIPQMAAAGFWMNIIGIIVITLAVYFGIVVPF